MLPLVFFSHLDLSTADVRSVQGGVDGLIS